MEYRKLIIYPCYLIAMEAIILAAGKGERMHDDLPKPLVYVKGKAILDHQLNYLLDKVDKIVIAVSYKSDEIINHVNLNYKTSKIVFSIEDEPKGTAATLKNALSKIDEDFVLVLNCDDLTDINISHLEKFNENVVCVSKTRLPFGRVIEREGYAFFEEKPLLNEWVSCGWYFLNKNELLKSLPDEGSLEYDVFPQLNLKIYYHEGLWNTFNTKKDIAEFERRLD